jgi:hypothetical protein
MSTLLQITTVGKKKEENLLVTVVEKATGKRVEVFKDTKHRKQGRRVFRFALDNNHPYQVLSDGARAVVDQLIEKRKHDMVTQLSHT